MHTALGIYYVGANQSDSRCSEAATQDSLAGAGHGSLLFHFSLIFLPVLHFTFLSYIVTIKCALNINLNVPCIYFENYLN